MMWAGLVVWITLAVVCFSTERTHDDTSRHSAALNRRVRTSNEWLALLQQASIRRTMLLHDSDEITSKKRYTGFSQGMPGHRRNHIDGSPVEGLSFLQVPDHDWFASTRLRTPQIHCHDGSPWSKNLSFVSAYGEIRGPGRSKAWMQRRELIASVPLQARCTFGHGHTTIGSIRVEPSGSLSSYGFRSCSSRPQHCPAHFIRVDCPVPYTVCMMSGEARRSAAMLAKAGISIDTNGRNESVRVVSSMLQVESGSGNSPANLPDRSLHAVASARVEALHRRREVRPEGVHVHGLGWVKPLE